MLLRGHEHLPTLMMHFSHQQLPCGCEFCVFLSFLFYVFVSLLAAAGSASTPSCSTRPSSASSHKSTRDLQSSNCSCRLFMSCIQESRKLFDSIEHILHAQYRGRGKNDFLHLQGLIQDGKRSETTKNSTKTTGRSAEPGSSSSNASGVVAQVSCIECFIVDGLLSRSLSLYVHLLHTGLSPNLLM